MTVTTQGFVRPRLNDIKADYDQRFKDALGAVNTAPDAVIGQLIGIFSAALDDAYESLQNCYDSMYPFSAEGAALDGAVAFIGLTRLSAAPTTVTAMLYGSEGTFIPSGVLARATDNRQYSTTTEGVISRANAGDVEITVSTVTNSANYQIIAGGISVVYTADSSATGPEIASGLAALFDTEEFNAVATGNKIRIRRIDSISAFPLTVDSKLTISLLGSPFLFTCLDLGAYPLPANTLARIDSGIVGWDTINNILEGDTGRFVETDEELRARHLSSVRVTGAATLQAMRARILAEVESVEYVAVYENRLNVTDEFGLPPHSVEVVVQGGINQAVANKVFQVKPAGIQSHGNTTVTVIDENGDGQVTQFSRPTPAYAWIRVSVNLLTPEEPLPDDVGQAIKDAVLEYGNALEIGQDIVTQRFYGPIYAATRGIGSITLEAAVTSAEDGVPVYATTNITIERAEVALFDANRITVVGV
jgi:uncharacterized phage protein gp47/JayE